MAKKKCKYNRKVNKMLFGGASRDPKEEPLGFAGDVAQLGVGIATGNPLSIVQGASGVTSGLGNLAADAFGIQYDEDLGQLGVIPGLISGAFQKDKTTVKMFDEALKERDQSIGAESLFRDGGMLTEFNEGGLHSENTYGGVPQGMGSNGKLNMVEEGETKFNNYIFSNARMITKDMLEGTNLPKSLAGMTFAQASKSINKEYKERPNDPISKKTTENALNQLMQISEATMPQEANMNEFAGGGNLLGALGLGVGLLGENLKYGGSLKDYYQTGGPLEENDPFNLLSGTSFENLSVPEGLTGRFSELTDQQLLDRISQTRMRISNIEKDVKNPNAPVPKGVLDQNKKELNDLMSSLQQRRTPGSPLQDPGYFGTEGLDSIQPRSIATSAISDQLDTTGFNQSMVGITGDQVGSRQLLSEATGITPIAETPKLASTSLDPSAVGVTGNQVSSSALRTEAITEGIGNISDQNIGSALRYAPAAYNLARGLFGDFDPEQETLGRLTDVYSPSFIDREALTNRILSQAGRTRGDILNVSGGDEGAARANLLAANLGTQRALGEAFLDLEGRNIAERSRAEEFERQAAATNLQQANLEADINARNRAAAQAARERALSQGVSDLGNIGREQVLRDIVGKAYGYTPKGQYIAANKYGGKMKYGGKLRNKYKRMLNI